MNTLQRLINKVNAKQDFTHNLRENKGRYAVSYLNDIYKGENPSIQFDLVIKLNEQLELKNCCSIGGWLDKKTNLYYLNRNLHFQDINIALMFAKNNEQLAIYDLQNEQLIYLNNK
jgi:hypothetical protein